MRFGDNLVDSTYWFVKLLLLNCLIMLVIHKVFGQKITADEYYYVGFMIPAVLSIGMFISNLFRRN